MAEKKLVLNKFIDHTNLKSTATETNISELCQEAIRYKFATVCIEPCYVKLAKKLLKGSKVGICTVIGFPLGVNTTAIKVAETKEAIKNGATEIDMVINVGHLKDKKYKLVQKEITEVKKACGKNAILKVILETCHLTDEEKIIACKLAVEVKADFVKTSTGFGIHGATVNDILLMKKAVEKKAKIKAAGGIRDKKIAEAMIAAGAHRIGASASIEIVS
ncbi:MAG: deoxyribose-phosphate aldolase [Chitinophagaceae bacterium]